uniref:RRM domain-containing protein n=1 Tax=Davidia involucrata TaxID=16924 RepID=A0A5B6ZS78_DAVIN
MNRSSRQKEKYGNSSDCNEGTAARTRPFSFDEIMLRRKNKKQFGDVEEGLGGVGNVSGKDMVAKVSDRLESGKGYRQNDYVPSGVKHGSEDFVMVSSRKKEINTSIKEDKLVKGKDKESRDSETKSKATLNKDISNKAKEGKFERRVHGRRKNDGWSTDDSENETEKRHTRDLVGKDRYTDRSRGKSEKESKRKHQTEVDEKNRDRDAAKKHDSGKWHDSEFPKRKERKESSQFRHEESRPKRRRSRSRERDKDRDRRSISLSPRSHKHTSYNVREHGELSSHSSKDTSKDRPGRQHSDVDRNRISTNGSSTHHHRHGGVASGLGGYSPRKRRTEAAAKTPSPANRSPEKRSAAWDLAPAGTDSNVTGSVFSDLQSSNQTLSSNTHELSSVVPVTSTVVKPPFGVFSNALSSTMNSSIDSIQLTQATRPMRRLYVENLPASASEKDVMDCINNLLLPPGVNHIQRTHPCISCIINKEKSQALVEFLASEDASAALSFDGRSFFGSILKIRRPKDFVEVTTGVPEKLVAAVDSISDIVKDSPHKIFIGGISKVISSEMLMEIASAFGALKAYRFEVNADLNEPCAFLEYLDHSITLKACAGLNGMRLGGQVLTVVQAIPAASSVENIGSPPFYGMPEHAKLLLEKPTQVLKLKNVLDLEGLSSLSEPELEEILEDVRLECARFGTVKSVNVVKHSNSCTTAETCDVTDNTGSASSAMDGKDLECDDKNTKTEILAEVMDLDLGKINRSELSSSAKEPEEVNKAAESNTICDDKLIDNLIRNEMCLPAPADKDLAVEDPTCHENSNAISQELPNQLNTMVDQVESHNDKIANIIQTGDFEMENTSMVKEELKSEVNGGLEAAFAGLDCGVRIESDSHEKVENKEQFSDPRDVFEPGCILVEYQRTEASCMAAHCLHGRLFDNRIVTVGYVSHDIYQARFLK